MKKNYSGPAIITLLLGILFSYSVNAATYYAIANGAWNSGTTWAITSGGGPAGTWPVAGDIVYIGEAASAWTVTVPSGYSANCATIYMGSATATAATLAMASSTASLDVGGNVIIYGPLDNALRLLDVNEGTMIISGNLEMGNGQTAAQGNRICQLSITTGSCSIGGNLVFNNVANSSPNQTWIVMTAGAGTLNLAGAFTIGNNIGRLDAGTTSTFNFNGSLAPQTIPVGISSVIYNNITINNTHAGGATPSAAITATNLTGNLSVQSGTLNNGGFAINLASAMNFSVANGAAFNLTGSSTMVTVSGGGTKTFSPTSLVNYAGASQTVSPDTYGHLIFSGSGVKTMAAGATTVVGTLSMEGTATAALTGSLVYGANAALQYKGSVPQISGVEFPATFNGNGGVIINNPNGVSLDAGRNISSKLTLTNGIFASGVFVLSVSNTASAAIIGGSAASYIDGNLERGIAAGINSYSFPIGNSTAYVPVDIDFLSGTVAGSLLANTTDGDHPDIANTYFNSFRTVNRHWTLTATNGLATASYNATFNWESTDEDLAFTPATADIGKYDAGTWTYPTMGTRTATSAQITGVSGFSDFQVGNFCDSYPTAAISGDASICSGDEVNLRVDLTGTAPWTYSWYDGETITTVSGVLSSPSYITVYPTKNTTYTLVDVMDGVGCIDAGTGSVTIKLGPTAIVPDITASPGMVAVTVIVKDFLEVGAISLTMNYDKDVITFNSYDNTSGLIEEFYSDETGANGVIRFTGITLTGWTLNDDEILLTLYFNYTDGYSDLMWDDSGDGTQCEFAGPPPDFIPYCDSPTDTYYINGSVGPIVAPPPPADVYWMGSSSTEWYNPSNWLDNTIPTMLDNVVIEGLPPNFPVYNGNFTVGGPCFSITLDEGTQMEVAGDLVIDPGHYLGMPGGSSLLRVSGSWNDNGTFDAGNGSVEFFGSNPGSIGPATQSISTILDYQYETFAGPLVEITDPNSGPTGDNTHYDADLGFTFFFSGQDYSQVRINSNGWISLNRSGDDYSSFINEFLFLNVSPVCVLAPWWDNLKADGLTTISYKTENGTFTCEWKDILSYNSLSTTRLTFQVKLYESDGRIEFIYGTVFPGTSSPGEGASIGIKDDTGGTGHFREGTTGSSTTGITNLKFNTDWPVENIRFRLPANTSPEVFWKVDVTKTGGAVLNIQRDVQVVGTP